MKKMVANEKIDYLIYIICFLVSVVGLLIIRLLGVKLNSIYFMWIYFILFFPTNYLRRKKQYKKIDELRKVLHLSLEEIRELVDIGKYDLMDWRWDKAYIPRRKLYFLEDKLETLYIIQFKKKFEFKKYENKSTEINKNDQ